MADSTLESQLDCLARENAFLKKYFALKKKCEQIQQANEKLVNRIQHINKIVKRYKRDRRFLVARLDEYGDKFQEAQVPVPWEEDQLYVLRPPPPYPGVSEGTEEDVKPSKLRVSSEKSALSAIQPLLHAHGLDSGHSRSSKSKKTKAEREASSSDSSAYALFCKHKSQAISEEYYKEYKEKIPHHELTKRLSQQWALLSPSEKLRFTEMHEREKVGSSFSKDRGDSLLSGFGACLDLNSPLTIKTEKE